MIVQHTVRVPRSARYCVVGERLPDVRAVWVVLHGYGQLAHEFAGECAPLAGAGRIVVAPEALSRFYVDPPVGGAHRDAGVGASWMTREDREAEIRDYVEYLDTVTGELGAAAEGDITLRVLGFSQGAATAARWAVFGQHRVTQLVLWGGLVPDDVQPALIRERVGDGVTLVAGSRDRIAQPERLEAQVAQLRAGGVETAVVTFEGGHRLDEAVLRQLSDGDHPSPSEEA